MALSMATCMQDWPATIFSKLPYLDHESKEYLGESVEFCFAAVGDAFCDKYPVQVREFAKGTETEAKLQELVIEKGGGSSTQESYDLAALYFAHNVKMSKAVHPILIFIGDEGLYDFVDKSAAEDWSRVKIEGRMKLKEVFAELKRKFSVYLVRKPYGSYDLNGPDSTNKAIQKQWEDLLGEDHVCYLPKADRVVDVIFGIFAKETDKEAYFKKELTERQLPDKDGKEKVDVVLKSLETIHKTEEKEKEPEEEGHSFTRKKKEDKKAANSVPLT